MKVLTILVVVLAVGLVAYKAGQSSGSSSTRPPAFQSNAAAQAAPAQSVSQSSNPTQTQPPAQPTLAPPTAIVPADTPAGTVLEVGKTWRQGGMELTVMSPTADGGTFNGKEFGFSYTITNRRGSPVILHFLLTDVFTITDNRGQVFVFEGAGCCNGNTVDAVVNPNKSYTNNVYFTGNLTRPDITDVRIAANNLSTITGAAWHYPIVH